MVIAALAIGYGLTRVGGPTGLDVPIDAVAVLPFENVSGDLANEYLSDGIAETLINDLSKLADIRVVPPGYSVRLQRT